MEKTQEIELTEEQIYRQSSAINYSSLATLDYSPKQYQNKLESTEEEDSEALLLGSALDCLLTDKEQFHKKYYVMTESKPSVDTMLAYAEEMFKSEDHEKAFAVSGYKRAVSTEKWEKEGKPYYEALKASKGKTVLSFSQYTNVEKASKELLSNPFTSKFFVSNTKEIEIKFQTPIYWKYTEHITKTEVECKSLIDVIIIDHANKIIVPADLKSTSKGVLNFKSSYVKYRYYLQAAFYLQAVINWTKENNLADYKVLEFRFIVVGFGDINPPLIYLVHPEDIAVGSVGGFDFYGNFVKGWKNLITDLVRHKNENQFEYSWEVYDSNGHIPINMFQFVTQKELTEENVEQS